jgi:hypothetical protein
MPVALVSDCMCVICETLTVSFSCHRWHTFNHLPMLQPSTEVEFTLAVSFSYHRWHTYNHLPMLQASTKVELTLTVSFSGKWLYVCHLWHEKDTVSVNSTSVDACSIGKWLNVCHLWHEKDTVSVYNHLPMLQASTKVELTLTVSFSCHRWHTYNHLPRERHSQSKLYLCWCL